MKKTFEFIENRWLNLFIFTSVFYFGCWLDLYFESFYFIYISLMLFLIFVKDKDINEDFLIDKFDKSSYDYAYFYNMLQAFMHLSYFIVGFNSSHKLSIDLAYSLLGIFAFTRLWFVLHFIPVSGFIFPYQKLIASVGMITVLIGFAMLVSKIVHDFSGFEWFSPILTTPISLIFG